MVGLSRVVRRRQETGATGNPAGGYSSSPERRSRCPREHWLEDPGERQLLPTRHAGLPSDQACDLANIFLRLRVRRNAPVPLNGPLARIVASEGELDITVEMV